MGNNSKNRLCWSRRFETIFNGEFNTKKTKIHHFFSPISGKKIVSNKQHQSDRSDLQHCTKNKFFSVKNTTKLCAEGAIGNLMIVLLRNEIEVNQFWSIVQSPINLIQKNLGESAVPKAVQKHLVANVIQLKIVFGFFVRNSSIVLQVCSKLNALKTWKTQSKF